MTRLCVFNEYCWWGIWSFFQVVVNCWEILRFGIWLLFLLIPICLLSSYLLVKVVRELNIEGKRQGYLETQILFLGFMIILWWRMFPWTSRNSHALPDKVLEEYHWIILGKLQDWGSIICFCVLWAGLADAVTSR